MYASQAPNSEYHTLTELCQRKEQLREKMASDSKRIHSLWSKLTQPPKTNGSSSQRLSSIINTGGSILDGLILGWKLYRKFGKKGSIRIFGKRI